MRDSEAMAGLAHVDPKLYILLGLVGKSFGLEDPSPEPENLPAPPKYPCIEALWYLGLE